MVVVLLVLMPSVLLLIVNLCLLVALLILLNFNFCDVLLVVFIYLLCFTVWVLPDFLCNIGLCSVYTLFDCFPLDVVSAVGFVGWRCCVVLLFECLMLFDLFGITFNFVCFCLV